MSPTRHSRCYCGLPQTLFLSAAHAVISMLPQATCSPRKIDASDTGCEELLPLMRRAGKSCGCLIGSSSPAERSSLRYPLPCTDTRGETTSSIIHHWQEYFILEWQTQNPRTRYWAGRVPEYRNFGNVRGWFVGLR